MATPYDDCIPCLGLFGCMIDRRPGPISRSRSIVVPIHGNKMRRSVFDNCLF